MLAEKIQQRCSARGRILMSIIAEYPDSFRFLSRQDRALLAFRYGLFNYNILPMDDAARWAGVNPKSAPRRVDRAARRYHELLCNLSRSLTEEGKPDARLEVKLEEFETVFFNGAPEANTRLANPSGATKSGH